MRPTGPASVTAEEESLAEELKAQLADGLGDLSDFSTYDFVRFVRACEGDVDAAEEMLSEHITWRKTVVPAVTEQSVVNELATGKAFFHGTDREGRPIIYVFARHHDTWTRDAEETERFVVWVLREAERRCRQCPSEQFVVVFDYDGFSRRNFDTDVMKYLIAMLKNHAPERLHHLYQVNCGWLFSILWGVVSPLLPAATKRKITMLRGDYKETLRGLIPPESLLKMHGGDAEFEYSYTPPSGVHLADREADPTRQGDVPDAVLEGAGAGEG